MSRSRDLATIIRESKNVEAQFADASQRLNTLTKGGTISIRDLPPVEKSQAETLSRTIHDLIPQRLAFGVQIHQLDPANPLAGLPRDRSQGGHWERAYELLESLGASLPEAGRRVPAALAPQLAADKAATAAAAPPAPRVVAPAPALAAPVAIRPPVTTQAAPAAVPAQLAAQAAADRAAEQKKSQAEREADELRKLEYEKYLMKLGTPEGRAEVAKERTEAAGAASPPPPPPPLPERPKFNMSNAHLTGGMPATADMSFAGTPGFWGGPNGVVKQTLEQAVHNFNIPYEEYEGDSFAPLAASEIEAARLIQGMAGSPDEAAAHRARTAQVQDAGNQSVLQNAVDKYLQPASAEITPEEVRGYTTNLDDLIREYRQESNEHFVNELLPQLRGSFIARGALHSGSRLERERRALERHVKEQDRQVLALKRQDLQEARQMAEHQKARLLNSAGVAGKVGAEDVDRRIASAQTAQDLSSVHHGNERLNIDALQQLGGRFRAYQQRGLDKAKEDWIRRKEHPFAQVRELSEIVNRHPPTGQVRFGTPQTHIQDVPVSPFTVAGSGLGQLIGNQMLHRKNDAHGGRIHKAVGGDISEIPERIELMNALKQRSNELNSNQQQPFWGWFTNMMTGIGANVSRAPNRDIATAASMSMPYAQSGYEGVIEHNRANKREALGLQELIAKSQIMQQEREERRQMMHDQFRLKELVTNAKLKRLNMETDLLNRANMQSSSPVEDPGLAHERETEEEMLRDIDILNKKTGTITKPGTWASRAAANKDALGHSLARILYDDEALAALDTLAKNRNELSVTKSGNLKSSNQTIDKQISGSIPSADISGRAAQALLEKSIIKKGGDPAKLRASWKKREKFRAEVKAALEKKMSEGK